MNTRRSPAFGAYAAIGSEPNTFWEGLSEQLFQHCHKVPLVLAIYEFIRDLTSRGCTDATQAKFCLTLRRLVDWCQNATPPTLFLSELNVPTIREWFQTLRGASLTRHHEHERIVTFFYFCVQKGWLWDNPATRIKNLSLEQREPEPFTREQYEAILTATICTCVGATHRCKCLRYRRVRAFVKLLRWSGLRVGDAACLAREQFHGDHLSLGRYGAKHRRVKILLPPEVLDELRTLPANPDTDPKYFFWNGRTKRKSEVSNWERIFADVVREAARNSPNLFIVDERGRPVGACLSMLRHTFAVEYLLAGMSVEEVSVLLGHSSVVLTQQLYARWLVRSQRKLAASQRTAWRMMSKHEGQP